VNFEVTKILNHLNPRTMSKINQLSFAGETIYVGLDAHKTNWKINSRMGNVELASFSQDPQPQALKRYFNKHYPGASLKVVYEAGFCGFGIQRSLSELGIECIVVNAADVPSSDKERKRKDDKRDARKLSRELAEGNLKPIYIPGEQMEQARTLIRQRYRLQQDKTRCQNRIKQMLMFSGLKPNIKHQHWSKKHVHELEKLQCKTTALRISLDLAIGEYKQIDILLKQAVQAIRDLAKQSPFAEVQKYLESIDGIGLINGMLIQTEIQDIRRFKALDSLCDYAGFVPDISSSDDRTVTRGITSRCNEFLRQAIIESSWILIRKDPAMLMKYNQYKTRMKSNKAIIRIGKHLLSRIRYVWSNQKEYERGIVK
jgi:transposase